MPRWQKILKGDKMQTKCDECNGPVKQVGRLTNVKWKGVSQKLCKECRGKLKKRFR